MEREEIILSKKTKNLIIISLVIAIVGVLIAMIFIIKDKIDSPKIEDNPRSFEEIFWESNTAEEAITNFQKIIDDTPNADKKAKLLEERAETLYIISSSENIFKEQILKDALEADSLVKTARTASILKDYYHNFGDEEKAKYYETLFYNRVEKENE